MPIHCTSCGHEALEGDKFCRECGNRLPDRPDKASEASQVESLSPLLTEKRDENDTTEPATAIRKPSVPFKAAPPYRKQALFLWTSAILVIAVVVILLAIVPICADMRQQTEANRDYQLSAFSTFKEAEGFMKEKGGFLTTENREALQDQLSFFAVKERLEQIASTDTSGLTYKSLKGLVAETHAELEKIDDPTALGTKAAVSAWLEKAEALLAEKQQVYENEQRELVSRANAIIEKKTDRLSIHQLDAYSIELAGLAEMIDDKETAVKAKRSSQDMARLRDTKIRERNQELENRVESRVKSMLGNNYIFKQEDRLARRGFVVVDEGMTQNPHGYNPYTTWEGTYAYSGHTFLVRVRLEYGTGTWFFRTISANILD